MDLYPELYIRWQMDGLISGGGLKTGEALKWDFTVFGPGSGVYLSFGGFRVFAVMQ